MDAFQINLLQAQNANNKLDALKHMTKQLNSQVNGIIEILKKVKVLDLSFNEFKGSGFELLENFKGL